MVHGRGKVAAIGGLGAVQLGAGDEIEKIAGKFGVTEEITILGGLRHAVVDAGHVAGDRAGDAPLPRLADEVVVERFQFCVSQGWIVGESEDSDNRDLSAWSFTTRRYADF